MAGRERGFTLERPDETVELDERHPIEAQNEILEETLLEKMGADANAVDFTLEVNRVSQNPDGSAVKGRMAKLFITDASEYDNIFNRLFKHYGNGLYRIFLKKNGRFYAQEDMLVETPAGHRLVPVTEPETHSNGNGGTDQALAGIVRDALERQTQMLERQQRNDNPVALMTQMVTCMSTLMTAIQPAKAPGLSVQDMIALVTLGKDWSGGGSGETNLWDIVKGLASPEIIAPALTAIAAASAKTEPPKALPSQANPAPQAKPQPTRQSKPPQGETSPQPDTPEQMAALQKQIFALLVTLLKGAEKGSEPELYADFTLDQMPIENIARIVEQPDPIALFIQSVPEPLSSRLAQQRPWLERYIDLLRQDVAEWRESEQAQNETSGGEPASHANGDTGRGGGNFADAQSNGPDSPPVS